MTNTTNITTSYDLRTSTVQSHEASIAASPKKARKILTPSKTASCVRNVGHDCETLETHHAVNKVTARLFHSLFRFGIAHAYNCETRRGTTHLNGAKSTCGGCESAHAALSPTLYDDILQTITTDLETKSLDELKPLHQEYLQVRFALTDEDKETLSSVHVNHRIDHLSKLLSRLSTSEKKGTFANTATEFQRNATFDNPRSSNKVDCYLESHLRPLEDQLATECKNDTKTPPQALEILQNTHRELLEMATMNLQAKESLFDDFYDSWKNLILAERELETLPTDQKFILFLDCIKLYQEASYAFFEKKQGTPSFKSFKASINSAHSSHTLTTLQRCYKTKDLKSTSNLYENTKQHLKIPPDIDAKFDEAYKELQRRLLETENQLKVLDQNPDEIKAILKYQFGTRDTQGVLRTPSKTDMATSLSSLMTSHKD